MSHIWTSHGAHMHESWHTYALICMSPGIHANEPCHSYAWVMVHIWMSHYSNTLQHIYRKQDGCTWGMFVMCHITHSYVEQDSFILCETCCFCTCVTWLIQISHMTFSERDKTHLHVWHGTLTWMYVTRHIHMRDRYHSDANTTWRDSFIFVRVTWIIHM